MIKTQKNDPFISLVMQKNENSLYRIRKRQIPVKNQLYDIPISKQTLPLKRPKLCTDNLKQQQKQQKKVSTPKPKQKLNLFDIIVKKYILRKPKKHSKTHTSFSHSSSKSTSNDFSALKSKSAEKNTSQSKDILVEKKDKQTGPKSFNITHYSLLNFYNNSLHLMTRQQLQQSISCKKIFLQMLEFKRLKDKQTQKAMRAISLSPQRQRQKNMASLTK